MKHGNPLIASSGYVAQVDEMVCEACGTCVDACPVGALSLNGTNRVNRVKCKGWGVCAGQWPSRAIALVSDERKGSPLDVRMLVQSQPTEAST